MHLRALLIMMALSMEVVSLGRPSMTQSRVWMGSPTTRASVNCSEHGFCQVHTSGQVHVIYC
jgi:hypothetical protein